MNSLDYARYEFFYPWDYASERIDQFMANHKLITSLKRQSFAEFRYLDAFQKFIQGIPLTEQFRLFDDALAVAPWNDSLRARIFAQYSYLASTQRDPSERSRLMRRANAFRHGEAINQPTFGSNHWVDNHIYSDCQKIDKSLI